MFTILAQSFVDPGQALLGFDVLGLDGQHSGAILEGFHVVAKGFVGLHSPVVGFHAEFVKRNGGLAIVNAEFETARTQTI